MKANPLRQLQALGQSVWLDYIQRAMLSDGTVARLIDRDGISGMTSNPTIFEQAISGHPDYRAEIERLRDRNLSAHEIYETLTFADVCQAADLLRPTYVASGGRDGFVSIEVSPHLAQDADATCLEAARIWRTINRTNLMIKVPATTAGVVALRRLMAIGINVNATLLFGIPRYREIALAYLDALEEAADNGLQVAPCASVASFFLSRIDTLVDHQLDAQNSDAARALRGEAAVASARLAYEVYRELFSGPRWQALEARGAHPQRLLWASTSTKNPAYSDVKYVEALVAPDTVSTQPPATLDAYRNHGRPQRRIDQDLHQAHSLEQRLHSVGVELATVAATLEHEGLAKFTTSYERSIRLLQASRVHEPVDTH